MNKQEFIRKVNTEKQSGGVRFNVVQVKNEVLMCWTTGQGERHYELLFMLKKNQRNEVIRQKIKTYRRWLKSES
ncbi:hypothetical protein KW855_004308 [Salmonella enterica]|nr:hypothetical protein [Salmonella enterica]EBO9565390.1 hypothetical protein [Salmonella enterica]ECH2470913.1 hypothetical protein [Salmonella enterica]EDG9359568.1 hypothetical protein [Salmonella enterica]EEP8800449.1 hypothetical protein [Salmonella enterica]